MWPFRNCQLDRIEAKVDAITKELKTMSANISANLQALETQIAQNVSVEASAVQLIQGIATELQNALNNSDDAALPALVQQLNSSATSLAAAVAANTPASTTQAAPAAKT
jgi:pyridoxine 5'-phosphate synthase PdxJ